MTFSLTSTAIGVVQAIAKPDLVTGRTIVQTTYRDDSGTSAHNRTAYTVTAGKTLYVTTLGVQGKGNLGQVTIWIGDNINAAPADESNLSDALAIGMDNDALGGQIITFASPMKFTNSIKVKSNADYVNLRISIVGWEE